MSPFKPNPLETEPAVTYTNVNVPLPDTTLFSLDEDEVVCCFYYPMLEWLYSHHKTYAENADKHFRLVEALPASASYACSSTSTNRMYALAIDCLMEGVRAFWDGTMHLPCHDFSSDVKKKQEKLGCMAEQLCLPPHITAEVLETVREIERRTLEMEPVVGMTAYYAGYSYMEKLNRTYWDYPANEEVSQAVNEWFQNMLK